MGIEREEKEEQRQGQEEERQGRGDQDQGELLWRCKMKKEEADCYYLIILL
jgi:hypothetical protein